jgi:tetratricopeptide (TPR) repeat protein
MKFVKMPTEQQASWQASLRMLDQALQESPNNPALHYQIAQIYYQQGNDTAALGYIRNSLKFDSVNCRYVLLASAIYLQMDKPQEASRWMKSLKASQCVAKADYYLGKTLLAAELAEPSLGSWVDTLQQLLASGDANLAWAQGLLALQQGDSTKALSLLKTAYDKNPTASITNYLCMAALRANNPTLALAYLNPWLKWAPQHATLLLRKAVCMQALQQPDSAMIFYEKVVRLHPHRVGLWLTLSELAYQRENYKAAERYSRELLTHQPQSAEAKYQLALALVKQAKMEEAFKVAKEAHLLKPDWDKAKQLAERLEVDKNPPPVQQNYTYQAPVNAAEKQATESPVKQQTTTEEKKE